MTEKVSTATCLLCRAPVTKQEALKHGIECLQASGWPTGEEPSSLIMIRGHEYWLVVLARHDAQLEDLDRLIRDVWGECYGHSGSFQIGEVIYDGDAECSTGDMSTPLSHLVAPGSTFTYEYDDGFSPSLEMEVIEETSVAPQDSPLCLIARNKRPATPCDRCGDEAEFVYNNFIEDSPQYYCYGCLPKSGCDRRFVVVISNSPRNGASGYVEDSDAAVLWYPPGWSVDEIISEESDDGLDDILNEVLQRILIADEDDGMAEDTGEELDEILDDTIIGDGKEVDDAIVATIQDIGPDIDAFVEEEWEVYGERGASMAGDTVLAFSTFMHLAYGANIDAWDAQSVQGCLVDELSQNLIFLEEWPENAVPILCRFLLRMEASGRITNASELIAALKEVEPAFQKKAKSPEKDQIVFKHIRMKAEEAGIDTSDLDAFLKFAVKEFAGMAGFNLDNEEIKRDLSNLIEGGTLDSFADDIRTIMIFERCEDFCNRFGDSTILEHCKRIIKDLIDHPEAPLLRGDAVLWSAAIVYAVCQDMDLIRPGRGAPPIGGEISFYFGFERPSIRNKVRAMRAFLPD